MNNIFTNVYSYNNNRYNQLNLKKEFSPNSELETNTLKNINQSLKESNKTYNKLYFSRIFFLISSLVVWIIWPSTVYSSIYHYALFAIPVTFSVIYIIAAILYLTFTIKLSKQIFLKKQIPVINALLTNILERTNDSQKLDLVHTLKPYWKIKNIFEFNSQINTLFYIVNISNF